MTGVVIICLLLCRMQNLFPYRLQSHDKSADRMPFIIIFDRQSEAFSINDLKPFVHIADAKAHGAFRLHSAVQKLIDALPVLLCQDAVVYNPDDQTKASSCHAIPSSP